MSIRLPSGRLLVLIDLVLKLKLALTARARLGQADDDLLIDMIRDRPVRSGAVVLAALAPRPGRILLRLALGKRRRLALASPPRLLKLVAQPLVLGRQPLVGVLVRIVSPAAICVATRLEAGSLSPLTRWR
jgi:hypothetical protein